MAILILFCCFVSLIIISGVTYCKKNNYSEILLCSVLVFSIIILAITEILSIFRILNHDYLVLFWLSILATKFLIIVRNFRYVSDFVSKFFDKLFRSFKKLSSYEKILLYLVAFILLLIFIQGVVYPPNTWDSLTYHMSRIANWVSQQSVNHYPSHIVRQIYQPPLTEFIIMNFNLLSNSDYFSNSVQFLFLIFSLFAIACITDHFGLNRKFKIISSVLAVTVPIVILEASNTKNDILVSFFVLSAIYFALKSVKEDNFKDYLFLGISVGLGFLTKGTAYIFLAPLLLIIAVLFVYRIYKTREIEPAGYALIAAFVVICINSPHYLRNYNLNQNILGLNNEEVYLYKNEKMSPTRLISNVIKNAGLHISSYPEDNISTYLIDKYHSFTKIRINNKWTNYKSMKYKGEPQFLMLETSAPNKIHFYLIVISFLFVGFYFLKKQNYSGILFIYFVLIISQALLFCYFLKWQPWHSRLHMTLFLVSVPLIAFIAFSFKKYNIILNIIIPILIFYALAVVLFNYSRPLIPGKYFSISGSSVSVFDDRYKKYFANRPSIYEEYRDIKNKLDTMDCKFIGIEIRDSEYEYPLFVNVYTKPLKILHLNVSNFTKKAVSEIDHSKLECIISSLKNENKYIVGDSIFTNASTGNEFIWLYK